MIYYNDLSYYSLQHFENAQNVGWINTSGDFNQGEVPEQFIEKLWAYMNYPVNTIRSDHHQSLTYHGKEVGVGYSEIRVLDRDGKTRFAAPDAIVSYICDLHYLPPEPFIHAVINGPQPNSTEYQAYFATYHEDSLWGESKKVVQASQEIKGNIIAHRNEVVVQMIHNNVDLINILTSEGSLLNTAIINKNVQLAKQLIYLGIDIHKFSGIELITALNYDATEIIDLLLAHNISFNLSTPYLNPLFIATKKGNLRAVKQLLERGIDTHIQYSNEFIQNLTVLQLAQQMNHKEIVALLK